MLKVTTDRTPYYAGKPNAQIVKMCMEQVGAKPEEVLVVGDRLYTDIACGINAGVETALVYTGEAKPEDLVATEFMPEKPGSGDGREKSRHTDVFKTDINKRVINKRK